MSKNIGNKNICIFTATRAEYGLLHGLMQDIQKESELNLQLVVSGTHLSKQHGETIKQIEQDGFAVDYTVDLELGEHDQRVDVARAMSLATSGVAEALNKLEPDVLVLLGDRYELLGAASAALIMGVPIFHLHGGEITEGAYDDSIRHAISKMATWHGVANEEYRKRVIQMGEQPKSVFNVGSLGVDNIKRLTLLSKEKLEKQLDFKFANKNILVTYHPVTNLQEADEGFNNLLSVLERMPDVNIIFTYPNADHGHNDIIEKIQQFVKQYSSRSKVWKSLGQLNYFSVLQYIDAVVGNSSSGIIEAPSFDIATVNIGNRQKGRLRSQSIIDCSDDAQAIASAVNEAFKTSYNNNVNIYGDGGASTNLMEIFLRLESAEKSFFDITTL